MSRRRDEPDDLPEDGGAARWAAEGKYFQVTRRLSTSLLFILPLLAVYELGLVLNLQPDVNAVAALVKSPVVWLLHRYPDLLMALNAAFIVVVIVAAVRVSRRGALHPGTFLGMLLESALYALLLGPLALAPLEGRLQFGGFQPEWSNLAEKLVISCGAGLYEELFFRLGMLAAIAYLARELGGLKPFAAGLLGLALTGAVFSALHFLNPGETVDLGVFLYRLLAGILLGVIFLTRGFGIAAWTHALYDVYVLCFTLQ